MNASTPPSSAVDPSALADAAAALARDGHAVVRDLFDPALIERLRAGCVEAHAAGLLRPAAVGRGDARRRDSRVRGDAILWLERSRDDAERAFFDACDTVRTHLNRSLMLGAVDLEAHYALYPPGARYRRHRDRFRDDDLRVLSLTCYLNTDWRDDDGGALRLYTGDAPLDVLPRQGVCVLFASAQVEHEVLPARRDRYSIAGWFRRRPVGNALPVRI